MFSLSRITIRCKTSVRIFSCVAESFGSLEDLRLQTSGVALTAQYSCLQMLTDMNVGQSLRMHGQRRVPTGQGASNDSDFLMCDGF